MLHERQHHRPLERTKKPKESEPNTVDSAKLALPSDAVWAIQSQVTLVTTSLPLAHHHFRSIESHQKKKKSNASVTMVHARDLNPGATSQLQARLDTVPIRPLSENRVIFWQTNNVST